jgi:hypothetical protein
MTDLPTVLNRIAALHDHLQSLQAEIPTIEAEIQELQGVVAILRRFENGHLDSPRTSPGTAPRRVPRRQLGKATARQAAKLVLLECDPTNSGLRYKEIAKLARERGYQAGAAEPVVVANTIRRTMQKYENVDFEKVGPGAYRLTQRARNEQQ